jgi:hypothetical protein
MSRGKSTLAAWEPWDDEQKKQVAGLLSAFNNDPETVCAVMDCQMVDLDMLCLEAFGVDFAGAAHKYELIGKARLKTALFRSAEGGNAKAIDMLAREHLGLGATLTRREKAARDEAARSKAEEVDF